MDTTDHGHDVGNARIAVVGPGAMGSLLAARFALAGIDVRLVGRRSEQAAMIRERGLVLSDTGGTRAVRMDGVAAGEPLTGVDFAIVCVKSYDTRTVAGELSRALPTDAFVVTLQNGAGNLEILTQALGPNRVLAGVSTEAALLEGFCRVRHTGQGETRFGDDSGGTNARLARLTAAFRSAGFVVQTTGDVATLIWRKLVINAGINPVTALLRVPNGYVESEDSARTIVEAAVREAVRVARAEGVSLDDDEMVSTTLEVARRTAGNQSSMARDLANGRPTEIDAINGFVVLRARIHGISVPVNEVLSSLIRSAQGLFPTPQSTAH